MNFEEKNDQLQKQIEHLLVESGGELTEQIEQLISQLDANLHSTIEWCCKLYERYKLKVDNLVKKIDHLTLSKKSNTKSMEFWKGNVDTLMRRNRLHILDIGEYELAYRKSYVLHIESDEDVPEDYWKTKETTSIDKVGIKAAIKAGILKETDGLKIIEKENIQIK